MSEPVNPVNPGFEESKVAPTPITEGQPSQSAPESPLILNVYQAAYLNKLLASKNIRVEPNDIVKRRSTNPNKKKKKLPKPTYEFSGLEQSQDSTDPSLLRRTSQREKKPTKIQDLGYEPKSGKITRKQLIQECESILKMMQDDMVVDYDLSPWANQFDQVTRKLREGNYKSTYFFGLDVRNIFPKLWDKFSNNHEAYQRVQTLAKDFEAKFKPLDNKNLKDVKHPESQTPKSAGQRNDYVKGNSPNAGAAKKVQQKAMSNAQKNELTKKVRSLSLQHLRGISTVLGDYFSQKKNSITFDINKLPPAICHKLEKYVNDCLSEGKKQTQPLPVPQQPVVPQQSAPVARPPPNGIDSDSDSDSSESSISSQDEGAQIPASRP